MISVEISEAEANLDSLVDALEQGAETEIVLLRDGRPAMRLLGAMAETVEDPRPDTSPPSNVDGAS